MSDSIEIHLTRRIKLFQQTTYENSWANKSGIRQIMVKNNDLKFVYWFKMVAGLNKPYWYKRTLVD